MPARVVVGGGRSATGRVPKPWRDTRDDPTRDRTDARNVLAALPVPESRAVDLPGVATVGATTVRTTGALGAADSTAATTTPGIADLVAVEVVPRPTGTVDIAQPRAVGLPPAGHHGSGRAEVLAGQKAAEVGIAVTAERTAATPRAGARADGGVGARRLESKGCGCHRHGRGPHRRRGQKTSPRRVAIHQARHTFDQFRAHRPLPRTRSAGSPIWNGSGPADPGRRAANASGSVVKPTTARPASTPTSSTKSAPPAG